MMTTNLERTTRTCIGCSKKDAPEGMVRLVVSGDEIAVDAAGGAFGRGAHVHPFGDCIAQACRGGLSRAFKREIKMSPPALRASIREAYVRRAVGMILGARRAGHLVLGADAVLQAKNPSLVVVAADAGSIVSKLERAVATGHAVSFGKKAELGELFGTGETAVFAVCHDGVARALQDVVRIVHESGTEER